MSRRSPMSDVEEWFDMINEQLEEASNRFGSGATNFGLSGGQADVDLIDRGDEYVVTIDLPGFTAEAVTAKLTDRTLFVEAEREGVQETETQGDERYVRMERSHESISRRVRLPEPVDVDDVSARMNNGVLTVKIGKAEPRDTGQSIDIE